MNEKFSLGKEKMNKQRWILVRHAKSDWNDPTLGDKDRPLNARGRKAAKLLGEKFLELDYVPERVLCSSAERTQQTLKGLMQSWAQYSEQALPEILYFDELYLAAPDVIRRIYEEHSGSRASVLTIGHNPGMELLASELVGELIEMKTAHMVVFEREEEGDWRLVENIRGED